MDIKDYLQRAEIIRKNRFMTKRDLSYETRIDPQTLINIAKNPSTCSLATMKKLKGFVDKWEIKSSANSAQSGTNMSGRD